MDSVLGEGNSRISTIKGRQKISCLKESATTELKFIDQTKLFVKGHLEYNYSNFRNWRIIEGYQCLKIPDHGKTVSICSFMHCDLIWLFFLAETLIRGLFSFFPPQLAPRKSEKEEKLNGAKTDGVSSYRMNYCHHLFKVTRAVSTESEQWRGFREVLYSPLPGFQVSDDWIQLLPYSWDTMIFRD